MNEPNLNEFESMLQAKLEGMKAHVVSNEEADARELERKTSIISASYEKIIVESQIPVRHKAVNPGYDGIWGEKCKGTLKTLAEKKGVMIAIVSEIRGNGKTQIGAEAIKQSARLGRSALFSSTTRFFMDIKATYKPDNKETESDVLKRFTSPQLLVIDEFGRRGETDWEDRLLFFLIDSRYNDMKDTLMISNQTEADFMKSAGDSISSRLAHVGGFVNCKWETFRKPGQH